MSNITIGSVVPQLVIDHWVETHENGRRSYEVMRYIADQISRITIAERSDNELDMLIEDLWRKWTGASRHQDFRANLEYAIFSWCASKSQVSQLFITNSLPIGYKPYWRK
jgi:hypothetical protein